MRKLLALVLFTAALATAGHAQQVQVSPANRTIAVTTTDTAERRADVATLHVGYQLFGSDSASVYAQAAQTSQAIAHALEQAGVPNDAVASVNQDTGPTQDFGNRELTPTERAARKFQANQSWTVKTTPDRVAAILAAAVQAGANQSGSVDWALADEGALTSEAAGKALSHAKAIASQMAQNLGGNVGKLLYASNEAEAIRPRVLLKSETTMEGRGGGSAGGILQKLELSAPLISRSATVSAIFAIE